MRVCTQPTTQNPAVRHPPVHQPTSYCPPTSRAIQTLDDPAELEGHLGQQATMRHVSRWPQYPQIQTTPPPPSPARQSLRGTLAGRRVKARGASAQGGGFEPSECLPSKQIPGGAGREENDMCVIYPSGQKSPAIGCNHPGFGSLLAPAIDRLTAEGSLGVALVRLYYHSKSWPRDQDNPMGELGNGRARVDNRCPFVAYNAT